MADARIAELERLLQESQLETSNERQRASNERQRADEARLEASNERQRADEAQLEVSNERQRADEARLEASNERQRASNERQRADEASEQSHATTLAEYIRACHLHVFSRLHVESDHRLTTKGSITSPRDKLCPTTLKQWPDFIQQQRITYGVLFDAMPDNIRQFESQSFLSGLGNRIFSHPIASEKDLEYCLHLSVEDPVKDILNKVKDLDEVRAFYDIGEGVTFQNHPNALSDASPEVVEREMELSPPSTPDHGISNQLRPDQICVYKSENGTRSMLYVCEYKAPHKLTLQHLRAGLRPMDVFGEVVNRRDKPNSQTDPDGHFQYLADRLAATALSQTYHYMMEGGLDYGLMTTGEAIVFLKVDWDDPQTLYYHLTEPASEVAGNPDHFYTSTAVGQYLAFSLLALGRPRQTRIHDQAERQRTIEQLDRWEEDFESTLQSVKAEERRPPAGFERGPNTYSGIDRSPIPIPRLSRDAESCRPRQPTKRRDSSSDSSGHDVSREPPTPSPAERTVRRSRRIQAQQQQSQGTFTSTRQAGHDPTGGEYCTQACLRGLVRRGYLDPSCPNVALHDKRAHHDVRQRIRHPLSHKKWLQLVTQQLQRSLDDGVTPLDCGGARGVLFRITLLSHGYTFVAKGTVRAFIPDLQHEAAVYRRLHQAQGAKIPVYLGSVDLRAMNKIYYYDFRVYIVYLSLLSWGGRPLRGVDMEDVDQRSALEKGVRDSLEWMHRRGVIHRDVRVPNMLMNPERRSIMLIDFERSKILPDDVLGEVALNAKGQRIEELDKERKTKALDKARQGGLTWRQRLEREDMNMADYSFLEVHSW